MIAVDIGDCRLCLKIPTDRATLVPDRWRCVQAWDRRCDSRLRGSRKTLNYEDNETDEPTVPDIRGDDRFRPVLFDIWLSKRTTRGRPMTDFRLPGIAVDDPEAVHISTIIIRPATGRSA